MLEKTEWAVQRLWQHWAHKTKKNTTQHRKLKRLQDGPYNTAQQICSLVLYLDLANAHQYQPIYSPLSHEDKVLFLH